MAVAGPDHLETAISLHNLGTTVRDQRRYTEAEELLSRSLRTFTAQLGADHPKVAEVTATYEETRRLARVTTAGVAAQRTSTF